jgi:hypothetical protein
MIRAVVRLVVKPCPLHCCLYFLLQVLQQRLQQGQAAGEGGFILDGFPRCVGPGAAAAAACQVVMPVPRQEE